MNFSSNPQVLTFDLDRVMSELAPNVCLFSLYLTLNSSTLSPGVDNPSIYHAFMTFFLSSKFKLQILFIRWYFVLFDSKKYCKHTVTLIQKTKCYNKHMKFTFRHTGSMYCLKHILICYTRRWFLTRRGRPRDPQWHTLNPNFKTISKIRTN